MCHPTTCRSCRGTTWAGCGSHVDQVMRNVPRDRRCSCSADARAAKGEGLVSRLFGR